ncbi:MAG: hypothetical protein ACUVX8_01305 [Candidatus Zipacnadales bacterium]
MITYEALQLGVVLLLPLGLLTLLLGSIASARGRTRAEIARGLCGIVGCLAGVIAIGLALSAWRGGPLLDYTGRGVAVGTFSYLDAVGIVGCVGLFVVALVIAKGLMATQPSASSPESEY